ncbi:hypothetical protein BVY01_03560 [bacterium I07]|nr:hypothetical protein BVY01_03560 [bacterium I07]
MRPDALRVFHFSSPAYKKLTGMDRSSIEAILNHVADDTDTASLVVALYLLRGTGQNRGTAYVRHWLGRNRFYPRGGKWSFIRQWPVPENLPDRFKLIRMRLDANPKLYPHQELDMYGWQFHYQRFSDHLATLFAHELHHYRRFHLNLHPGEGEQSANKWALDRVKVLNYQVEGKRIRHPVKKSPPRLRTLFKHDPYRAFRHLKRGDLVRICRDPRGRYSDVTVRVVRPIRMNSKRLVIETPDGKIWRWPMEWILLSGLG